MMRSKVIPIATLGLVVLAACGKEKSRANPPAEQGPPEATLTVRDTLVPAVLEAAGIAEPYQRSVLSTRLMGSVTAVLVQEGDRVQAGQLLGKIDSREVMAKGAQVEAGIVAAEARHEEALRQAERIRGLYADSAATKAQLDAAETGLAQAEAGLRSAGAARAEVEAVSAYAEIRAPFAGEVTRRFVDAGAFAAPGAPLVELQDASRLRVTVSVSPGMVTGLRRGTRLDATIEDRPAQAVVEGVIPAPGGALYTVNGIVENADRRYLPGSAAVLLLPQGTRRAILVPETAVIAEGDLSGVRVVGERGSELRWVRLGRRTAGQVEVLSGLQAGERVLIGATAGGVD
jgi:RND family efflux transporter MFP subunit